MTSQKKSSTASIYGSVRSGDLKKFSKCIEKVFENIPETTRKRVISLCIKYGRIEFFEPLSKAYALSGRIPVYKIQKCKAFYLASPEVKIGIFVAFQGIQPSIDALYRMASEFLLSARPKKDFKLLKFFHDHDMRFRESDEEHFASRFIRMRLRDQNYNILEFAALHRPNLISDISSLPINQHFWQNFDRDIFFYAIRKNRLELVNQLIYHCFEIEHEEDYCSPVLYSIRCVRYDIAKFLISKGACLEGTDYERLTPVRLCAKLCNIPMLKCLIEAGAETGDCFYDWVFETILKLGSVHSEDKLLECFKFLAETSGIYYRRYELFLMRLAIQQGLLDIFEYLVTNCQESRSYWKAAHFCIVHDRKAAFSFLERHNKINVKQVNEYGEPLIVTAVLRRSPYWVKRVIELGSPVNLKCSFANRTPLCCAVQYGGIDTVSLLLKNGANAGYKDAFGHNCLTKTFSQIPGNVRSLDILDILLEAGVDPDPVKIENGNRFDYILKFQSI